MGALMATIDWAATPIGPVVAPSGVEPGCTVSPERVALNGDEADPADWPFVGILHKWTGLIG